jgi:HEPN domain-containing protein
MSDERDPLARVERATLSDYAAQSALRRKKPLTHAACFHAQQCAEKYLKALLVAGGHPFSKTHDLLVLNDECTRAGILLSFSEDNLSILLSYAVRVRYPGEDPTPEEAREALDIARSVRRVARKFLNVE